MPRTLVLCMPCARRARAPGVTATTAGEDPGARGAAGATYPGCGAQTMPDDYRPPPDQPIGAATPPPGYPPPPVYAPAPAVGTGQYAVPVGPLGRIRPTGITILLAI